MDRETLIALVKAKSSPASMRHATMASAVANVLQMTIDGNFAGVQEIIAQAEATCQQFNNPAFVSAYNFLATNSLYLPANGGEPMVVDQVANAAAAIDHPSNAAPAGPNTKKRNRDAADVSEEQVRQSKRAKISSKKGAAEEEEDSPSFPEVNIEAIADFMFPAKESIRPILIGTEEDRNELAEFVKSERFPALNQIHTKLMSTNESKVAGVIEGERFSNIGSCLRIPETDKKSLKKGFNLLTYNQAIAATLIDYMYVKEKTKVTIKDLILALTTEY